LTGGSIAYRLIVGVAPAIIIWISSIWISSIPGILVRPFIGAPIWAATVMVFMFIFATDSTQQKKKTEAN
jgi:hypothetical protein